MAKRFRTDGLTCKNCGKPLRTNQRVYCSYECTKSFLSKQYKMSNPFKGKTSATTGAISELRVAVDLMIKGWDVFRALSPSCSCDLAIKIDDKLVCIEVRTAHYDSQGKICKIKTPRDKPGNYYAWVLFDKIIYEPEIPVII